MRTASRDRITRSQEAVLQGVDGRSGPDETPTFWQMCQIALPAFQSSHETFQSV